MKKFKLFNILLILALFFMIPTAYAHDIATDPDKIITIPELITDSTKIEVDNSYGDYVMYYQYVKMNSNLYEKYNTILEEQKNYAKENKPGENATASEIADYNSVMGEYEASKNALKPGYVGENFKTTQDGTVPFYDKSSASTEVAEPYVLWIKITNIDGEDVVYDEKLVLYKAPEEDVTSPETSDNIMIIGILAVSAIGLMALSYKKSRA